MNRCKPTLCLAALLTGLPPAQEPGPSPPDGVRLVYSLPVDALQRSLQGNPDDDLERLLARTMETTIATLHKRLGKRISVARAGASNFAVDVPAKLAAHLPSLRRRIETVGTLEFRIVATSDYDQDGVRFDLEEERQRLKQWLAAGGRERVLADAMAIRAFETAAGASRLRWIAHRIKPKAGAAGQWQFAYAQLPGLRDATVRLFTDQEWNGGKLPAARAGEAQPQLIELFAVNWHELGFTHRDLDARHTRAEVREFGPAVRYGIVPRLCGDYAEWSEKHVGHHCAIICNGEIVSAPKFVSKIPGVGIIQGTFTEQEAEDLVVTLRSGELPAAPKLLRQEALPAEAKRK